MNIFFFLVFMQFIEPDGIIVTFSTMRCEQFKWSLKTSYSTANAFTSLMCDNRMISKRQFWWWANCCSLPVKVCWNNVQWQPKYIDFICHCRRAADNLFSVVFLLWFGSLFTPSDNCLLYFFYYFHYSNNKIR